MHVQAQVSAVKPVRPQMLRLETSSLAVGPGEHFSVTAFETLHEFSREPLGVNRMMMIIDGFCY